MYKYAKKLVSLATAILTIVSANSVALAVILDPGQANIVVTSATQSFNPSAGEKATITYKAEGDTTANDVTVRIYRPAVQGNNKCDTSFSSYLTLVKGPVTETAKNTVYNAVWDGRDQAGAVTGTKNAIVPAGVYCYRVQWSNIPSGPVLGFVEGFIQATQTLGGSIGGTGTGTVGGATQGGVLAATGRCGAIGTDPLNTSANPTTIDPRLGESTYICYEANQDLLTGFSLWIYDGSNRSVAQLYYTGNKIAKGAWSEIPWDGKYSNGTVVPVGTYRYKFLVSNQTVGSGSITVVDRYVAPPVNPVPPTTPTDPGHIDFFVNPTTVLIDNVTKQTLQNSTLTYNVTKTVSTGLSIYVRDVNSGNIVRSLYTKSGTLLAGAVYAPVSWDGKFANGTAVPAGPYRFILSSAGQEIDYWDINVQYVTGGQYPVPPTTPTVFIAQQSASPTTINLPNGYTTINFVTGKTVSNFKVVIRDSFGAAVAQLFPQSTLTAGAYVTTWTPGNIAAGSYTYTFEATNESPIFGGTLVVSSVQATSFIVSHNATPQTFNPYSPNQERTIINFTTGKTVNNFRITIKNQQGGVVATLFPNPTLITGTYPVFWDGTALQLVNGIPQYVTVPQGGYTYLLEADNNTSVPGSIYVNSTTGGGNQNSPVISDFGPDKTQFNPTVGDTVTLRFQVNQDARADVYILGPNNTTVRRLLTSNNQTNNVNANVTNSFVWRGKEFDDTGVNTLPVGNYTYYIEARNSNGQATTKQGTVYISNSNTGGSQLMDVSNVTAASFYPEVTDAALKFYINRDANVTIKLYRPDGSFLKTLRNNQFYSAGSNTAYWDGTDYDSTNLVPAGSYRFTVEASNSQYGFDSDSASVTVIRSTGGGNQLMDVSGLNAISFNPRNSSGALNFYINRDADVTVTIYRPNGSLLRTLYSNRFFTSGNQTVYWDGRESGSSNYVASGTYRFSVEATSPSYGYDSASANVVVLSTGSGSGDCGNFSDVNSNNYLCPAINFVRERGIFAGYPDGTLRPNAIINRAEILAVMQKAFGFTLQSYDRSRDGSLGFSDLKNSTYEWYMPYVKTFKSLGLVAGYPDGTYRPERTMNTAELYLVFLKSAQRAGVANFNIDPNGKIYQAPYLDTPVRTNTRWYIKYAEFAQLNDLVTTDRFYPERGITRGQVIKLIHDMYQKNLINYTGGSYTGDDPYYYNNNYYNNYYNNNSNNTTNAVVISNIQSPSFNPESRTGTITFNLNRAANVTVSIYRPNNTFLKTIENNKYLNSGSQTIYWDGTDVNSLNYVSAGTYRYTITANASSYGSDSETGYITVSRTGTSGNNLLQITSVFGNAFLAGSQGSIGFYNNYDTNITITINRPDGTFLRTLQSNQLYLAGSHTVVWDGRDTNGSLVPAGIYRITVTGTSSQYGTDSEIGNITVM